MRATKAIWAAISNYYSQPGLLSVVNGLAVLYSVPLIVLAVVPVTLLGHVALAPLTMALLLGVMPNPAGAGLHFCARETTQDESVTVSEFHRALALFWKPAAALFTISFLSFLIIAGNIAFYTSLNSPVFFFLNLIWIYLFVTWLLAQLYLYPMLLTVDRRTPLLIYRNALVLALRRPISSLVALLFWLALLVLSCATGLILVLGLIVPAMMQQSLASSLLPIAVNPTRTGARL